jgi:hypothetical protein
MMPYKCPRCGVISVTWDARASAFVCCNGGCGASIRPVRCDGVELSELIMMLTLNKVYVLEDTLRAWAGEGQFNGALAHGCGPSSMPTGPAGATQEACAAP